MHFIIHKVCRRGQSRILKGFGEPVGYGFVGPALEGNIMI